MLVHSSGSFYLRGCDPHPFGAEAMWFRGALSFDTNDVRRPSLLIVLKHFLPDTTKASKSEAHQLSSGSDCHLTHTYACA